MHVHLLLPDLIWPARDFHDIYRGLDVPALERLLAKGRRHEAGAPLDEEGSAGAPAPAWLYRQFGVERQSDWPAAPFCLLADGGAPGDQHWLRADPVHLRLEGNRLILADSSQFSVTQHESEALAASLNAHFSGAGLHFHPLHPRRWYLRVERAPALQTTPLAQAAGRDIDALLPRGADAPGWHARLNEIQMLLHGHAINAQRETAGAPAINSVWLWGAGRLPQVQPARFNAVWSRDPFAAGLAQAARIAAHALPAGAAELLRASPSQGVNLVVLDQLCESAQYGDAQRWRETLARLERDWFAPLLQALRQERIGMLTLHAPAAAETTAVETARGDLRRFWRRVKPLGDLARQ